MIKKGNTPAEYVDLLFQGIGAPRGVSGSAVRDAARVWLTDLNAGSQTAIADQHDVQQHSLSRLITQLRAVDQLFSEAAKYHSNK